MGKYDLSALMGEVKAEFEAKEKKKTKASNRREISDLGMGNELKVPSADPNDYVIMPQWWQDQYGIQGIPFSNGFVQYAGDSDTGKTSIAILAMKAAQDADTAVLFIETEGKTGPTDLLDWGVDPENMILIQQNVVEEIFSKMKRVLLGFFEKYPKGKMLVVFDSYGNTVSQHDLALDIAEKNQQVGGSARTNRFGLGQLIVLMRDYNIAPLIVNYHYANIGTMGVTQAGGKALKFFTMLGVKTMREGDWTTGKNIKGAYVKHTTFKNHYTKGILDAKGKRKLFPKEISLQISGEGVELKATKEKKE